MNPYDALTWITVAVLGPGAVLIFVFFIRDVRRILADMNPDKEAQQEDARDSRRPR